MKCVKEEVGIEREDLRVFTVKVRFAFNKEEKMCDSEGESYKGVITELERSNHCMHNETFTHCQGLQCFQVATIAAILNRVQIH